MNRKEKVQITYNTSSGVNNRHKPINNEPHRALEKRDKRRSDTDPRAYNRDTAYGGGETESRGERAPVVVSYHGYGEPEDDDAEEELEAADDEVYEWVRHD